MEATHKILIGLLSAALAALAGVTIALRQERSENARYKANQTALMSDVEYYKTESGKNAASVLALTLTVGELKKNYEEAVETARELGVQVKRLKSLSHTATETKVEVKTVVKDSVVYRNGAFDSLLMFRWSDPWVRVAGEIERDSVRMDVCSTDTLVQIIHKVPKKFLFFKWGCKAIRQEIVSKNPHTNIVFTDYIELK